MSKARICRIKSGFNLVMHERNSHLLIHVLSKIAPEFLAYKSRHPPHLNPISQVWILMANEFEIGDLFSLITPMNQVFYRHRCTANAITVYLQQTGKKKLTIHVNRLVDWFDLFFCFYF